MSCSHPETKDVVCFYTMEEEEAQGNFCRRMICLLRGKQQQHLESTEEERREGRVRGDPAQQSSPRVTCHSPEVQPVPTQLMSALRLKGLQEKMIRAAELQLHDPAVCTVCEQDRASLALKTFIRRKKTQLQVQMLEGRLNTHT